MLFPWQLKKRYTLIIIFGSTLSSSSAQQQQQEEEELFSGCSIDDYYGTFDTNDISSWTRQDIQSLLSKTHRNVLPYTSSNDSDDVWKALIDLDHGIQIQQDSSMSSSSSTQEPTVHLVYRDIDVPATPYGTPDTWNREHLWPKSLGVGYNGADFTDIHHLRPADWNVNAARGNLYFGDCENDNTDTICRIPATYEAAIDTSSNGFIFRPPTVNRGDIARALFYMDVRYSGGSDDNVLDLTLTDFPSTKTTSTSDSDESDTNEMAYLSQLLEWHYSDPVSDRERKRNDKACERWQGNRNIFVDFPDLVEIIFGKPKTLLRFENGLPIYGETSNSSDTKDDDAINPNTNTTYTPSPSQSDTSNSSDTNDDDDIKPNTNTSDTPSPSQSPVLEDSNDAYDQSTSYSICKNLQAGDILIVGVNSDDPDGVALVALENLEQGLQLYMTDNAWTGSYFRNNEGIISLKIMNDIDAGTVFGFISEASVQKNNNSNVLYATSWEKESGSFSLSTSGDSVIVYCLSDVNDNDNLKFLSAITSGTWFDTGLDDDIYGSANSAVPADLKNMGSMAVKDWHSYLYVGPTNDSKDSIKRYWSDSKNWEENTATIFGQVSNTYKIESTSETTTNNQSPTFSSASAAMDSATCIPFLSLYLFVGLSCLFY